MSCTGNNALPYGDELDYQDTTFRHNILLQTCGVVFGSIDDKFGLPPRFEERVGTMPLQREDWIQEIAG